MKTLYVYVAPRKLSTAEKQMIKWLGFFPFHTTMTMKWLFGWTMRLINYY